MAQKIDNKLHCSPPYLFSSKCNDLPEPAAITFVNPVIKNSISIEDKPFWEAKDSKLVAINFLITLLLMYLSNRIAKKARNNDKQYDSDLFYFQELLFPISSKALEYSEHIKEVTFKAIDEISKQKVLKLKNAIHEKADEEITRLQKDFVSFALKKSAIFSIDVYSSFEQIEEKFNDAASKSLVHSLNCTSSPSPIKDEISSAAYSFIMQINAEVKKCHPTV